MLSEVYLMAGKYAEAEAAAKAVIDCGYFNLMTSRFGAEKDKAVILLRYVQRVQPKPYFR